MSNTLPRRIASERRRFGRRTTFRSAVMIDADGVETVCFMVDISGAGARLTLRDAADVADEFRLDVAEDDFSVVCTVVHRTSGSVGVRFVSAPKRLSWSRKAPRPMAILKRDLAKR